MIKKYFATFLLFIFPLGWAQENTLTQDIADGYLDNFSKIEAAFILSGITHPDSLRDYIGWYEELLSRIKTFPFDNTDPVGSAKSVFLYIHSTWLKTYALESTTLVDIVRNKEFNCVSSTILFNLLCEDLMWDNEAFETPTHVYTIFKNFRQKLIVENTSTMGFDIMKNLKEYSKYLLQFYPQKEALQIGLDKLYYHENSKGRVINNTELLGLLAYNRAYLAKKNGDYSVAYEYVLLAQKFNFDSRSNINFEKSLVYTWGENLFSQNNFAEAFAVYADGYYRYPQEPSFMQNTLASFYMALQTYWEERNWSNTYQIIDEVLDLDIMVNLDKQLIRTNLKNWTIYFQIQNKEIALKEIKKYEELLVD